jgi:hypothetical protein
MSTVCGNEPMVVVGSKGKGTASACLLRREENLLQRSNI